MAKIVFLSISNVNWTNKLVADGFIESWAKVLSRNGNIVYNIVLNRIKYREMGSKVLHIKPDLIVTFNNVGVCEKLLKKLDSIICLFGSDSIAFWESLDFIKDYPERYFILNHSYDTYSQVLNKFVNFPKEKNIIFGHASDMRRLENIEQDINISFVGSLGNWNKSLVLYFERMIKYCINKEDYTLLYTIKQYYMDTLKKIRNKALETSWEFPPFWNNFNDLIPFNQSIILNLTTHRRFKILHEFIDLGLKIFSYPQIVDVLTYNPELFNCVDLKPSVSFEDNQITFNRSKISLNLPHGHAVNGFSWRVCEIMSTKAFLLSERRPDLESLMKQYIDFPMFESDAEARAIAIKLLSNENWRKELVEASNKMIEENCRFEKKIYEMEQYLGLKLMLNQVGEYHEIV